MVWVRRWAWMVAAALTLAACQVPPTPPALTPAPPAAATPLPRPALVAPTPTATPAANIVITAPSAGATVGSPVRVSGRARVFEAAVVIMVYDDQGKELIREPAQASIGAPEWGTFQKEVSFAAPDRQGQGRIEVISYSAKDGSVLDRATVAVNLQGRSAPGPTSPAPAPQR